MYLRERERDERETLISCLIYMPQLGSEPTTYVSALTGKGIEPAPFLACGTMLQPTEPPGQGWPIILRQVQWKQDWWMEEIFPHVITYAHVHILPHSQLYPTNGSFL